MTGFTPGPWVDNLHHERRDGGRFYTHVTATGLVPIACVPTGVEGFGRQEGRANAHLIASAPELFEGGEKILSYVGMNEFLESAHDDEVFGISASDLRSLRAALAKAKGETQ